MKKILTILNVILLATLITLSLYVFNVIDIPFLNNGQTEDTEEPLITGDNTQTTDQTDTTDVDKVGRKKSYDELIKKGNLYYEKGFYSLAVDSYTQASNANPSKLEPLLRIGELQNILGNFEQAKKMGEQIVKLNPQTVEGKIIITKADIGLGSFQDAKTIIDPVLSDDSETSYYQGMLAAFFGEYDRARSLLTTAVQKNTNAKFTTYAQNILNAINEFDTYSAGIPEHLKVLLAKSFVQNDEARMSKDLVWNVLQTKRDYRDAWIIMGYSYLKLKQYKEAVDALIEAKKQDPEKPETMFFLGLAYAANNQIDDAISELELAKKNGYEPAIYVEQKLAELYFQKEDYEKANTAYETVISMNSSDIDYFVRPIWIYIDKLNQPDKALALAEKAKITHPDEPMSYNLIGWAQVADNDFINGKKNLEKAIALNEKLDAPYLNLGWMYEKQNNMVKAKEFYKKAYTLGLGTSVGNLAAQRYNTLLSKPQNDFFMVNLFNN